jgi:PAT family beta-lactamase induction signal transducer AmpG
MIADNANKAPQQGWLDTIASFKHPRVITMLFLGFSAGIPILLIFSSLGLWLREAGVERSAVTFFSWAALGYSFKFVWAPLIDRLPIPLLSRLLGRRRAWILVSQFSIIAAIIGMASTDPSSSNDNSLMIMALATILLGFSSATQDIVIDAYRIESADSHLQAMMSSTYIAGYRIGMIIAGAGALFLADYFGSDIGAYNYEAWRNTYFLMAASMLIGVITTLIISEPNLDRSKETHYNTQDYLGFLGLFILAASAFIGIFMLSARTELLGSLKQNLGEFFANPALASFLLETVRLFIAGLVAYMVAKLVIKSRMVNSSMVQSTYVAPIKDFFSRYNFKLALLLLALIGLYRISDIVLGVIANVFYQDLQYSKTEIATIVKTFGLFMTLTGGFLGGILSMRYGVMRILFLGAVLTVATNLLFVLLAQVGYDISLLYVVISADNLTAGLASAAFIAFLSSLTNIQFTAVQYAIFSSLMTLLPKVLGGYSGAMVDSLGYENFFIIASIMGLPVLVLVWLANKHLNIGQFKLKD